MSHVSTAPPPAPPTSPRTVDPTRYRLSRQPSLSPRPGTQASGTHRRRHRRRLPRSSHTRWDVQGLRAVAVLAVIANHAWGWPRGGFVGVDVFFVISGFLITGLLLREWDRTGHISFSGFYRRRIKRIIPASLLVLAATVTVSWFVFNQARWDSTAIDGIWALLFAANWRFALQSTDYFNQDRAISPLQHYWSLGVEEQFYLVWPWLMLLVLVLLARSAASRVRPRVVVGVLVVLISVGSYAWALHDAQIAPTRSYFSTFSRAWELGLGALLAVAAPLLARLPERLRPVLAWIGLAGIVAGLFTVDPANGFQATALSVPVGATALVIAAGTGVRQQRFFFPLTNRAVGYVGDLSYSLYLWHFPVLILGRAVLGGGFLTGLLLVGIAGILSFYSYRLVEDPLRRSSWLLPRPKSSRRGSRSRRRSSRGGERVLGPGYQRTALSLLALVTVILVVVAMRPLATTTVAGPVAPVALPSTAPSDGASAQAPLQAQLQTEIASALTATAWPKLSPTMDSVMNGGLGPDDIHACGSADTINEATCTWGDPKAKHTIVIVGNSLAVVYADLLRQVIGTDRGWRVVSYGMYACGFRDMTMMAPTADAPKTCAQRPDDAVAAINRLNPDVVMMSGTGSVEAAESEIRKITVKSKLVLLPGPPADKNVDDCYSKVSTPADCVSRVEDAWGSVESKVANDLGGVYVNSLPWFCVNGQCPAFVGTTPMKLDRFHLTSAYNALIAPVVREDLEAHGVIKLSPA